MIFWYHALKKKGKNWLEELVIGRFICFWVMNEDTDINSSNGDPHSAVFFSPLAAEMDDKTDRW